MYESNSFAKEIYFINTYNYVKSVRLTCTKIDNRTCSAVMFHIILKLLCNFNIFLFFTGGYFCSIASVKGHWI